MAQEALTCTICGAAFIAEEQLGEHRRQVHADEVYVCPTCLLEFSTDNDLALHQQAEHSTIAPDAVPCPECGLAFATAPILEEHLARVHPHFPGMTRGG